MRNRKDLAVPLAEAQKQPMKCLSAIVSVQRGVFAHPLTGLENLYSLQTSRHAVNGGTNNQ